MRQQWRNSGGGREPLNGPACKEDAHPSSHAEHLCGDRAQYRPACHERPRRDCVRQHAHRQRGEKLGAKRNGSQHSDECDIHLPTPLGEVGEIQPDEHSAGSAGDPHKGVSEQRNREPAPRPSQGSGARPCGGTPFFHNHHVGGSTVSGKECSNLTENFESGNPL